MTKKEQLSAEKGEYVFRFSTDSHRSAHGQDPLTEMVRSFLSDVQEIGFLCIQGKRVYVDGFVLNNKRGELITVQRDPKRKKA